MTRLPYYLAGAIVGAYLTLPWWHQAPKPTPDPTAAIRAELQKLEQNIGNRRDASRDPDDFGRCHRLLERFPEWRERLPEVADKFPVWRGLVAEWDRLTAIYLRDLPTGRSDELFQEIQRLRGDANA